MPSQAKLLQKAEEIARTPGNNICAECPARLPTWASFIKPALPGGNLLAAFICQGCYKHHFEMGMKYCEVKSISMATEWSLTEVEVLAKTGNEVVNGIYEAGMDDWDMDKDIVTFDKEEEKEARRSFIRKKYQKRKYFSEEKYHAVMSKLNPKYNKDPEPAERSPRKGGLANTVLVPTTPGRRTQRRGSVGVYSTVSPEQEQTPKETEQSKAAADLKSQLVSAAPQARTLLGLPGGMASPEVHKMPTQRCASLRNMMVGDKTPVVSSLLLGYGDDLNNERDIMQLPNNLQRRGAAPAVDHSSGGVGMIKCRSVVSLRESGDQHQAGRGGGNDSSSRLRRESLKTSSNRMDEASSERNLTAACGGGMYMNSGGQGNSLLSTPGRGGRKSLMAKSASTRSLRSDRRSLMDTGGSSLLQENREVSTRERRTTGEASSRQQRRNSVGKEPSTRQQRSVSREDDTELSTRGKRSNTGREGSTRVIRTSSRDKGDCRKGRSRSQNIGLSSRIRTGSKTRLDLNEKKSVRGERSGDLRRKKRSDQAFRGSEGSRAHSDSGSDEFEEDQKHSSGLSGSGRGLSGSGRGLSGSGRGLSGSGRVLSGSGRSSRCRQNSTGSKGDSYTKKSSRKDSENEEKTIPPRNLSRRVDSKGARPAHVWKKHPSFRRASSSKNVMGSKSFDDSHESDTESEEEPDHVWKKRPSPTSIKRVFRTKSCDNGRDERDFEARAKQRLSSYKDGQDGTRKGSNEKKVDPKKLSRKRSSRKLARSKSVSTLDTKDCSTSSDEDGSKLQRQELAPVEEAGSKSNQKSEATNKYKGLTKSVRSSQSSGALGMLMAGGVSDEDTLQKYSGERSRRAGRRKSQTKDSKSPKGPSKSKSALTKKSKFASTGALGLLALNAEPDTKEGGVHSGFDKRVKDMLKKKNAAKAAAGTNSNSAFPKRDFESDKYKNAMVAQWLVDATSTH